MKHPNAATAGAAGLGPGLLIVWTAGHFGIDLNAEQATVVTGVVVTAVLFIGKRGLKGIIRLVWQGDDHGR